MPTNSGTPVGLAGDKCIEVMEERRVVELGVEVRQGPVACPAVWSIWPEAFDDALERGSTVFESEPEVE